MPASLDEIDQPILALLTTGEVRLLAPDGERLRNRRKELPLVAVPAQAAAPVPRRQLMLLLWGDRPDERAQHSMRQALAPRSGECLAGTEEVWGEDLRNWVEATRLGLRRRLSAAQRLPAETVLTNGNWRQATAWASRWAAIDPLSEEAHAALVRGSWMLGRLDEALSAHHDYAVRVREMLAQTPSSAFERLPDLLREAETRPAGARAARTEWPWVDQPEAFTRLKSVWDEVGSSQGRSVRIRDSRGSGKSRLAREFARGLAALDKSLVVATDGMVGDGDGDELRRLLDGLRHAPGIGGVDERPLSVLGRLAPWLRERFPSLVVIDQYATAAEILSCIREALVLASAAAALRKPLMRRRHWRRMGWLNVEVCRCNRGKGMVDFLSMWPGAFPRGLGRLPESPCRGREACRSAGSYP